MKDTTKLISMESKVACSQPMTYIARGAVSAARITISLVPRFKVLVAIWREHQLSLLLRGEETSC